MSRVKRGTIHIKKRRRILKAAKGFKWGRKNLIRLATTAVKKAGAHKYRARRTKKRDMRALWNIKINAEARQNNISYSKFIGALKKKNVDLDRKVLADIAEHNPEVFTKIVASVQ